MGKSGTAYGEGFDAIIARIKEATNTRTQVELASVLGIRQSSISDAKRRNSVPADWFLTLFRQRGINPDWIALGRGPQCIRTTEGYKEFDSKALSSAVREERAPYGDPMASAIVVTCYNTTGNLSEDGKWQPTPAGRFVIPKAFDCTELLVIHMDGSSMEPLIRRGAYLGIDREQKTPLSGEIYAVQVPYEGIIVRRLFLNQEEKRITLQAVSSNHTDQYFAAEDYSERIMGRLVWTMQEM